MASARKVRDRRFPQAEFEMTIAEAVGLLLRPQDVDAADRWSFQVDGDLLRITRLRTPEDLP